jgi:hypothetical protein
MPDKRTIKGNRFESFYSLSRQYADIVDRKRKGILMMLTLEEMTGLRMRMEAIVRDFKNNPGKLRPFNVSYPRTNSKIVGLNYEDTVELGDLAELLAGILVPHVA